MSKQTGKEKTLIFRNFVISVLIIALFVGIVLMFYRMFYNERRDNIMKDGEMSAMDSADSFNKYLDANIEIINLTAYSLDEMLLERRSDTDIQDYLLNQSKAVKSAVSDSSTGLYAYINGRFFSGTNWEPPVDYEPTERPWYTRSMLNKGKVTFLDPYVDMQSGDVMIGLAKTLRDGDSVIAIDLSLDQVQKITENSVLFGDPCMEMILNAKGVVVAHSSKSENEKNYAEEEGTLGAEIFRKIKSGEDNFELFYGNSNYMVYCEDIESGWYCVSVMDATAVFSPLNLILAVTISSVLIIVVIISAIMYRSSSRQLVSEKLSSQLSSIADVYFSVHDIDILADTFSVIRNSNPDVASIIGNTRTSARELIKTIMGKFTDPSSKEAILDFVDFSKLDHKLKNRNTVTIEFLSMDKLWRRARFVVTDRTQKGKVARALFLVENIDAEKRDRDMSHEAAELMNEQITAVASIYFSMHDIDLPNDTFSVITTKVKNVTDLVGAKTDHAQTTLSTIMERMTSERSAEAMRRFVDLSTLEERLKNTNTITEEFLSYKDVWSRARFVVSKRRADGRIDHVLWLVEGIDAEKRRRDSLTEAAETANYRISSITNIYMTVHEFDLETDTYTQIKCQSDLVSKLIEGINPHANAQAELTRVMDGVTDDAFRDDVRRFIDLSSLDRRLGDSDTIVIEFMNKNKLWRRGRFLVTRRGEKGALTRVLWLSEDIDKEKRARDKLLDISQRAVAASEAKSLFLSNMSHNIRTPINSMLGMNEMILRECSDKNILAYSENIRTAGSTLLGLVNDILDISKIEAGKMEIVPTDYETSSMINDLVNMIKPEAEGKRLAFELDIDPELPRTLRGDDVHIKQIIMNMLTNAVKYTDKGIITFCMGFEKARRDASAIFLNVSVKDTGIGIKQEDLKKLFSKAEDTQENEGAGLGMNIIRSLLELMGSMLEVESIYSLGSRFSFRLKQTVINSEPIGDYAEAHKTYIEKREKYHEKFRAPEAQVLAADDVLVNLMVFEKLLSKTAVKIDTASSGDEAIVLARAKKYDMIFLDHIMPEKNGVETLAEIRADTQSPNVSTPMICLTADAVAGAREQYIAAGFDDYITKPIDPEQLEDLLLKYLPKEKILGCEETDGE